VGKVLCFLYPEMADFEVTYAIHRLKNIGRKEIVMIGAGMEPLQSQSGFRYLPDVTIAEALRFEDAEALVIPGGPITASEPLITELIQKLDRERKLLAAICFGPQFLGRAGVLDRHRYTTSCSPERIAGLGVADPFPWPNWVRQRVVRDGHVITALGTAFIDFAFEIFDYLQIFASRDEMAELYRNVKPASALFE
jgi:putative intracellular protease/amidase